MSRYSFKKIARALGVVVLSAIGIGFGGRGAIAQNAIIPDNTLGGETSVVVPFSNDINHIVGGATRGANLFHSFEEFNVESLTRTDFIVEPAQITDVFARITGDNPSNIDGVLGVRQPAGGSFGLSEANLYLINPNGVIFDENAVLDVGGSFTATTASSVIFGDKGVFSASDSEVPASLLTVNPSAYLFDQQSANYIASHAIRPDLIDGARVGLRVPDGQSLSLLGGNVFIGNSSLFTGNDNASGLTALGGRINVGAVGGIGTISINSDGSFSFPNNLARADIQFIGNTRTDAALNNGGDILLVARNIEASTSQFLTGIQPNSGTISSQSGNVILDAEGFVQLNNSSIQNIIFQNANGNGGNIEIQAESLFVVNDSSLFTDLTGRGSAGNILINTEGRVVFDTRSYASSSARENAVGNGGDIRINADSLLVLNESRIGSISAGRGDSGNISIEANGRVVFDSESAALSNVEAGAVGNSGSIDIVANSLWVTNESQLISGSKGRGNGGDIRVTARGEVVFDNGSSAVTSISNNGIGEGGNIVIVAESLLALNSSQISSGSQGQGNSGGILINAEGRVVLDRNSGVLSNTHGSGAVGNGGDIVIESGSLSVVNNSQIGSGINGGSGNAGNILIDVGGQAVFDAGSSATTATNNAIGNGGSINIEATNLLIINNSTIDTRIQGKGQGEAGNISVDVEGQVVLDNNGGITSILDTDATGNSGNIAVQARELLLFENSAITSRSYGRGSAGIVLINIEEAVGLDSSSIDSATFPEAIGDGGQIEILAGSLLLINESGIVASSQGRGDSGNIIINVKGKVTLANSSRVLSSIEPGAIGDGGNIDVRSQYLLLDNESQIRTNSNGQGNAGSILIDVRDDVIFNDRSNAVSTIEENAVGNSGGIRVDANSIYIAGLSLLTTTTEGRGNAGDIVVNSDSQVTLEESQIRSEVEAGAIGNGGNISIITNSLLANGESPESTVISSRTSGQGNAGNIFLDIADKGLLFRSSILTSVESEIAIGNAGDILIEADVLDVIGSNITSRSIGKGSAGDIEISESNRLYMRNGTISTISASTSGGNILISADQIQLELNSGISSRTFSEASNGGDITIEAGEFIIALDDSDIIASASQGRGGSITLQTPGFFGEGFTIDSLGADPGTLNDNNRADINAKGGVNGIVTVPDVSFLENGLTSLPDTLIAPEQLIANSCIARADDGQGTLVTSGSGGLTSGPSSELTVPFSTGAVQVIPGDISASTETTSTESDVSITEPTGIYQLADGRLVMSQECL